MSLTKKDVQEMIDASITKTIADAQGAPDTVEQVAAKAKKPKTTFDERRAMAAEAKSKHDAAGV